MHFSTAFQLALGATFASTVMGHGAIVNAVGNAGGQGTAIGIDESTPRTGTGRTPFQQDTTIFNGNTGCGRTLAGGANNMDAGTAAIVSKYGGLPQVTPGGTLQMTLHQVNADGAGPYRCTIDQTGTGQNFQTIEVTQNVRGFAGLSLGNGATPQPLNVQMPANMQCTGTLGGMNNVCVVRCQNQALAGPFGGCVPVQQASAGAANVATPPPPVNNAGAGGNAGGAGGVLGGLLGGGAGAGAGAGGNRGGLRGMLAGLFNKRSAKAQFEDDVKHTEAELEGLDELDLEWATERLAELNESGKKVKAKRAMRFRA